MVGMDTVMTPQPANRETVTISLFGPLAIREGTRSLVARDLGGARLKQVLEILLAARGHRFPTDRLAHLLWGERLPENEAAAPQAFISVLRRRRSVSSGSRSAPTEPRCSPRARASVRTRRSTQPPPRVEERTVAEEVREVPSP